jgi:hypothetical protein
MGESETAVANRLGLWILGCAVGCFAAGMAVGFVIPDVLAACCRDAGDLDPDERYVRQFAEDFGLSASQRQSLRVVLQRFHEEQVQVIRHASQDQLPPGLQAELTAARRRQSDRIYALLTDAQRIRYDDKSRAGGSVR